MTCIVAVTNSETVIMGADSLTTYGWSAFESTSSCPKVGRVGEVLLGVSGSIRYTQILLHCFTPPPHPDGVPDITYLARDFVVALQAALKEHGALLGNDGMTRNGDDDTSSHMLIGYRGRIYRMGTDFSLNESVRPFDAIGHAGDLALGSIHASMLIESKGLLESPKRMQAMIERALMAAIDFDATVGGRLAFESITTTEQVIEE